MKHDANELNEGETMILTLADRRMLDDKGVLVEDPEELENVLVVRQLSPTLCYSYGRFPFYPYFKVAYPLSKLLEIHLSMQGKLYT